MNRKGQIEGEMVSALAIMLLLFVFVLFFNAEKNSEVADSAGFYAKASLCSQLSSTIAQISYLEGKQKIGLNATYDFNITGNNIIVEDYSCLFAGSAEEAAFTKGRVIASEENGYVLFGNE